MPTHTLLWALCCVVISAPDQSSWEQYVVLLVVSALGGPSLGWRRSPDSLHGWRVSVLPQSTRPSRGGGKALGLPRARARARAMGLGPHHRVADCFRLVDSMGVVMEAADNASTNLLWAFCCSVISAPTPDPNAGPITSLTSLSAHYECFFSFKGNFIGFPETRPDLSGPLCMQALVQEEGWDFVWGSHLGSPAGGIWGLPEGGVGLLYKIGWICSKADRPERPTATTTEAFRLLVAHHCRPREGWHIHKFQVVHGVAGNPTPT